MVDQSQARSNLNEPSQGAVKEVLLLNWTRVAVIVGAFFVLSWSISPQVHGGKKPNQTEAISNARQIGLALFDFQTHHGSYPDVSTIAPLVAETQTKLPLGASTSNDFFRQMLASETVTKEAMFFAKIQGARKPDEAMLGSEALAIGECGFAYLVGLSPAQNPQCPIVVTPLIPGTDRFDPKPFDGKAVILRLDNSSSMFNIDSSGHVKVDGMNILDPKHPIWDGHPYSKIAYPE